MNKAKLSMKMTKKLKSCKGFSLIEVLVTLAIFTFIAGAINTTLLIGASSWQHNSVEVELQQDLRQAMFWMKNDIQQTGSASLDASIPINASGDSSWTTYTAITFQKVTGTTNGVVDWNSDTTQFVLSSNDLNRIEGSTTTLAAENIQSIQARRLFTSSDVVEIALQVQKKTLAGAQGRMITLTLDFKVQMRN